MVSRGDSKINMGPFLPCLPVKELEVVQMVDKCIGHPNSGCDCWIFFFFALRNLHLIITDSQAIQMYICSFFCFCNCVVTWRGAAFRIHDTEQLCYLEKWSTGSIAFCIMLYSLLLSSPAIYTGYKSYEKTNMRNFLVITGVPSQYYPMVSLLLFFMCLLHAPTLESGIL